MEQSIDEEIGDLQQQKKWIGAALIRKGVSVKAPTRQESASRKAPKASGGRKAGSTAIIKEIIAAQPDRVWMPAEVIDAAHAQGVGSTAQAIRVALRRMAKKGFLKRGPDDRGWILATSNGPTQESFDQAQSSQASHPMAEPAGGRENVG